MKKSITLNGCTVDYTLRKNLCARNIRLAVKCGGDVVVTVPFGVRESFVEWFIRDKAEWLLKKISVLKQYQKPLTAKHRREEYKKHKETARALAIERVAHFNQFYSFSFKKIAIRNQKTRWGSCSKKGNLNFNYKIALLPQHITDYIIVHEICHLGEFNHSQKFWKLVAQTTPDYIAIRKELKKGGIIAS